jgi:hypothetical protein
MRRQGGWAGLLLVGLVGIAATAGTVMVVESATNAPHPRLSDVVTGNVTPTTQEREGKVFYQLEEVKQPTQIAPVPAGGQK